VRAGAPPDAAEAALAASWALCRQVTRREARNFYYGLALLPRGKRSAMFALYAWMRHVDDIVDDENDTRPQQRIKALHRWRELTEQWLGAMPPPPIDHEPNLWPALRHAVRTFGIPGRVFDDAVAGQCQDAQGEAFETFEQLREYCYRVAGTVGVASIHIWGFDGVPETQALAVDRGVALQLTNILRDLREDAARGRVYLPAEDLARFGVRKQDLMTGTCAAAAFEQLMRFEIERARECYRRSAPLEQRIHPDCRATLATMTGIYHRLLEKIAEEPQQVMRRRVSVPLATKVMLALQATWLA